ncbi:MAG: hypothetical protein KTR28_02810 [Micavibrio sp.]|nr:hypothetical protein [Micavibrio sp.]
MARIAGASQYLASATLANKGGFSAQSSSILGNFSGGADLLAAGKRINRSGIGMSASSRAQLDQFMNKSNATFSTLLSVGVEAGVQNLQTQILGLRAKLPASMISDNAYTKQDVEKIGGTLDEEA